jgi:hypothetical protein
MAVAASVVWYEFRCCVGPPFYLDFNALPSLDIPKEKLKGTFMAVNCAALSGSLLESELFGYAPGRSGEEDMGKATRFGESIDEKVMQASHP